MVARLYNPQLQIQVDYILVSCSVAEEDTGKIMAIELAASRAHAFDANSRPEHFEMCNVQSASVPALVWGLVGGGMDAPIVKIHHVQKGS